MCLGYPYINPINNKPYNPGTGSDDDSNKYYASKTFVVFTELASSNIVPNRPTGGSWDTKSNKLIGSVVSTASSGNIY